IASIPRRRHGMQLGDQLVIVDERELEIRKVVVQPTPVLVTRHVVLQVLRKGHLGPPLVPDPPQIRSARVTDEPQERSTSATACAASPSPRPVNPRPSVVVARTLIGAPTSALSTSPISTRRSAIRGCSPIRMQSAFTTAYPATRT